jgi:rubrerythrin
MNDAQQSIARALEHALKAESDGRHFYTMAARTTDDPKGREAFLLLAEEEENHFAFLMAHHKAVVETGQLADNATLGRPRDWAEAGPIFSEAIRGRIKEAHFEMTALSVGMQLELSSIKFYEEQAASAADSGLKAFYEELAAWEHLHYEALQRQQEDLKQDYWAANAFTPF